MLEYTEFGLEVRKELIKRRKSMTKFAKEELGISCSYLSEILKGTRPGNGYKEKIVQLLGIKLPLENKKVG